MKLLGASYSSPKLIGERIKSRHNNISIILSTPNKFCRERELNIVADYYSFSFPGENINKIKVNVKLFFRGQLLTHWFKNKVTKGG